ncbi:MAG: EAL domain-containing protein [Rhizobiales bacterium]|nr:EAL domain-containing protein [Hyphomicrobiales bacterium]
MTSFVDLDPRGAVTSCNSAAGIMLDCERPIGRLFIDLLYDASKLGIISKLAVGQIVAALQNGSTTFHLEDGRKFLLQSQWNGCGGRRVEWTDISSALATAASHDPESGLLSREGFTAALNGLLGQTTGSLVFKIDIDDFGDLAERYGNEVAGRLVRRIAERIAAQTGDKNAHLARGTGGQFMFFAQEEDASTLTEALLDILGRPHLVDGKMVYSTVSIGIAPADGTDAKAVLRNAALALKQAKAEGGNQAIVFTKQMQEAVQRRRMLETELRKALALRQFTVVYQPQYQVEGRRLVGFEALLRWNHPEQGSISPAEFIPLAEELGLIVPIGEWALRTACRKAASWPEDISISVNISPLQFRSSVIVKTVSAALESARLEPTCEIVNSHR